MYNNITNVLAGEIYVVKRWFKDHLSLYYIRKNQQKRWKCFNFKKSKYRLPDGVRPLWLQTMTSCSKPATMTTQHFLADQILSNIIISLQDSQSRSTFNNKKHAWRVIAALILTTSLKRISSIEAFNGSNSRPIVAWLSTPLSAAPLKSPKLTRCYRGMAPMIS